MTIYHTLSRSRKYLYLPQSMIPNWNFWSGGEGFKPNFTTIAANLAIWWANLLLSIRVHTTLLLSMCHTMPFSAHALKKTSNRNVFFCGLYSYWWVHIITLFPNILFLLFLHVERVCKSFWRESLTRTSSSFA